MSTDVDISSANEADLRRHGMPEVCPANAYSARLPSNARLIPVIAKGRTFAGVGTALRLLKKLMNEWHLVKPRRRTNVFIRH